ncbi:MAG: GDSL-type esterase/lipase family protein, partial [Clostridia bacterium]
VCNYYPLLRTGDEEDGTVMTGWGMLLHKYVDARVVNLAASGYWASKWLEESFPIVEKEGKKGDIFVVQFGINDHDKSTVEEMTNALSAMIDRCTQKGIIPVLVSPQISAGYGWGEENNTGKSDGGAYEEFFSAVRRLSVEKGTFYVDLTDLSAGWFSEVGRDGVYRKYHLWDYENDAPGDMMHLSYKGADAMCRFFVLGLKKIADSSATDNWGNNLSLLKIW